MNNQDLTAGSADISVIIPVYNRQVLIAEAINSALRQFPKPKEVIVVDDCSSDDSAAVAAQLGASVIRTDSNMGAGNARNIGLRACKTKWAAFLDSDDEWLPGHLDRLLTHLGKYELVSESALASPNAQTRTRVVGNANAESVVLDSPFDVIIPENHIATSGVAVDVKAALAVGGFAAGSYSEDLDLWIRMLEKGKAIALGSVGYIYKSHAAQITANKQQMRAATMQLLDRYKERAWYSPQLADSVATVHAWDEFRRALRDKQLVGCVQFLLRILRAPRRLLAIYKLVQFRKLAHERGEKEWMIYQAARSNEAKITQVGIDIVEIDTKA